MHRHFPRTRTATMRSAAAHVSARQSTSNQLAIIDINKVISMHPRALERQTKKCAFNRE